jgi:hypothetical protein
MRFWLFLYNIYVKKDPEVVFKRLIPNNLTIVKTCGKHCELGGELLILIEYIRTCKWKVPPPTPKK